MMTEEEKTAFIMGMKYASVLVMDHWNDAMTEVNQKNQAGRSSRALVTHAKAFEEMKLEAFVEHMTRVTDV